MKRLCAILLCLMLGVSARAQFTFGTTGLMHLPTAEMQESGTLLMGWSWLAQKGLPQSHYYGWDRDDTMNYYFDITFFPWLEVAYDLTLVRGVYLAESYHLNASIFDKWSNQDRNFAVRLRVLPEGMWNKWVPQVVVGGNDVLHDTSTASQVGSSIIGAWGNTTNGSWGRYYIAVTKHFEIRKVGTLGAHVTGMYNGRAQFRYDGVGAGVNLWLDGIETGSEVADRWLHGINLMAEYDSRTVNIGMEYKLPFTKRNANGSEAFSFHLVSELYACRYFSGGLQVKIHLK